MSSTNSPSPPFSYSPIMDPIITLSIPISSPLSILLPSDNSSSLNTLGSSSSPPSNESPITSNSIPNLAELRELNGRKFRSVNEIFDYINQQPKEISELFSKICSIVEIVCLQVFASWKDGISGFWKGLGKKRPGDLATIRVII